MSIKNNKKVVLQTEQIGWLQLRSSVITDDATVKLVTTRDYANRNTGTGASVPIPYGINGVVITFMGTLTNQTASFKWKLYGYRAPYGPGQLIANGTGNIGDVLVGKHPVTAATSTQYYADYLTITAQYWPKLVSLQDNGSTSGGIANIMFDTMGISHLLCELTDCDAATPSETDTLEAIFTGF